MGRGPPPSPHGGSQVAPCGWLVGELLSKLTNLENYIYIIYRIYILKLVVAYGGRPVPSR